MRRGVIGIVLIVVALVALTALPAAAAGPHRLTIGESRTAELELPKSNGFELTVQIEQDKLGTRAQLTVAATREHEVAGYTTSRGVRFGADGSIQAQVRGLGRLNLRFDPTSTKAVPLPKGCEGSDASVSRGTFRGTISLRGRRGFPSSVRNAAPGTITLSHRQKCNANGLDVGLRADARRPRPTGTHELTLAATKQSGHGSISFIADEERVGEVPEFGPSFSVIGFSRDHGVTFLAFLSEPGSNQTFSVPDLKSLASAKVSPPAPFTGSAEFQLLEPKKARWTGNLAVSIPGLGHVPLAGAAYEPELCWDRHCSETGPDGPGPEVFGISAARERRG